MIYLPNKGKRGRILIGFLPNKESIRGAWAYPMHFHSLGELAREEPSEPGRIVGMLYLRKSLSLWRRCLAPLLQRNRRRQQDLTWIKTVNKSVHKELAGFTSFYMAPFTSLRQ